jgi:hypothetical protein
VSYRRMGHICSVARDLDISSTQILVLLLFANHENKKTGRCFPANETIAAEGHLNEKTVRRSLNVLRNKKLISTRSYGKTDLVTFHLPPHKPKVEALDPLGPDAVTNNVETLRPNVDQVAGTHIPSNGTQSLNTGTEIPPSGPKSPANQEVTEKESGIKAGRSDQNSVDQIIHAIHVSEETNEEEPAQEKEKMRRDKAPGAEKKKRGREKGEGSSTMVDPSLTREEEPVTRPKNPVAMKFLDLIGSTPKLQREGPHWDLIAVQLQEKNPTVDLIAVLEWIWSYRDPFWREQFAGRYGDPFEHFANKFESILDQYLRRTKSTIKKGSNDEASDRPVLQHFR